MKKRLLMQCLALAVAAGAYAFEVGDYIYTKTAKLKVTGANLVTNGNFDQGNGTEGWTSENQGSLAANWAVTPAAGPNGENVMASTGATVAEGTAMTRTWPLQQGEYAISYKIKSPTGSVSIASGGTNFVSFFANADASQTVSRQISEAATFTAGEWTEIVDTIQVNVATEYLVFLANNVVEGTQITNFEIHTVEAVFDTRPFEKRIAYVEQLLEDPNFNVAEAEQLQKRCLQMINMFKQQNAKNAYDNGLNGIDTQLENSFAAYLNVASTDIATEDYFKYVTDLTAFPKYNRGSISNGQQIGGFVFRGDNWLHGSGNDFLNKQIQGTFSNGSGSVALANANFPAGKYFIAADMRNAYCDSKYNYTYDLECQVKAFVGTDSVDCGTIAGEDYVRFYYIGELKEGENLEAGFWWNGPTTGSAFNINNFEIRYMGKDDIASQVLRVDAWKTFKTQWDTATSNRNKVIAMQSDNNYRWATDSLQRALDQWDRYYFTIINDSAWVDAEGNDLGKATADQLNAWATTQGFILADTTETSTDAEKAFFKNYSKYAVVRGYQYAINYVTNENKAIGNLSDAISDAETTRDDDMNAQGDKATFQTVIDDSKTLLDGVKANSTDATRETDEANINTQLTKLDDAKQAFIASAKLEPVINIDFSNPIDSVMAEGVVDHYFIRGIGGEMTFAAGDVNANNNTLARLWALGYGNGESLVHGDVLRVGKNAATVALPEVAEDDVLRIQFDFYGGYLVNRQLINVELRNAAGKRVAGFEMSANGQGGLSSSYNDFNNAANEGMDILAKINRVGSSAKSNAVIYEESGNKTTFDLIVDYKAKALKGTITNDKNGTSEGKLMPIPTVEADNVVTTFAIGTGYDNADRRSWMDNFIVYKYKSQAEGPITGISTVSTAEKAVKGGIYTINGVRVAAPAQKGLYIINGKKVVVK